MTGSTPARKLRVARTAAGRGGVEVDGAAGYRQEVADAGPSVTDASSSDVGDGRPGCALGGEMDPPWQDVAADRHPSSVCSRPGRSSWRGSAPSRPPSDEVANGTRPAASAAADPPLDPPGERSGFHGLRVAP